MDNEKIKMNRNLNWFCLPRCSQFNCWCSLTFSMDCKFPAVGEIHWKNIKMFLIGFDYSFRSFSFSFSSREWEEQPNKSKIYSTPVFFVYMKEMWLKSLFFLLRSFPKSVAKSVKRTAKSDRHYSPARSLQWKWKWSKKPNLFDSARKKSRNVVHTLVGVQFKTRMNCEDFSLHFLEHKYNAKFDGERDEWNSHKHNDDGGRGSNRRRKLVNLRKSVAEGQKLAADTAQQQPYDWDIAVKAGNRHDGVEKRMDIRW